MRIFKIITMLALTLTSVASFAIRQNVDADFSTNSPNPAFPLDGTYTLDFYGSSGNCPEEIFIKSSERGLATNVRPGGPHEFFYGEDCNDRTFPGDPIPSPEKCVNEVWASTLSEDKKTFEFFTYYSRTINGNYTKVPLSRMTVQLTAKDKVQADLLMYDRDGKVKPLLRCVFLK